MFQNPAILFRARVRLSPSASLNFLENQKVSFFEGRGAVIAYKIRN
jgi:hypothetical protein